MELITLLHNVTSNFLFWIVLLSPLCSGIFSFFVPSRYSWAINIISPAFMLAALIAGISIFFSIGSEGIVAQSFSWIKSNSLTITFGYLLDNLSSLMVLIVLFISFLIHLYSTGYMAGDLGFKKYFGALGIFTFSMIGLITSENLFLLFMFWELVGFSSYLLIGHWNEIPEAGKAAKKAFILNRVGDVGFLIGLTIIYLHTNTFQILSLQEMDLGEWKTIASICLFAGVAGKSAQLPLLTWLPDAMAGPTPVSALIHAATMVAAGVFLMARVFFLFSPEALHVVVIVGSLTSLYGASAALFQFDIKKILAYSTISQLGFMVLAMGVGSKESAILHLFTHAFFKAGLFLGAGALIHVLHQLQHREHIQFDVQDIRNLGGLRKKLPLTFLVFIFCGAALSGIPLFSGFQSKDAILSTIFDWAVNKSVWGWSVVLIAFLVSLLTIFYTFRLIWFLFIHQNENSPIKLHPIHEPPWVMRFPMILLSLCSLWWIVSINPIEISGWFHTFKANHTITWISLIWIFLGVGSAFYYFKKRELSGSQPTIIKKGLYIDKMYQIVAKEPLTQLSRITTNMDKKWIDGTIHSLAYIQITIAFLINWIDRSIVDGGVKTITYLTSSIGIFARSFQKGQIQNYLFWAMFFVFVLMAFLI